MICGAPSDTKHVSKRINSNEITKNDRFEFLIVLDLNYDETPKCFGKNFKEKLMLYTQKLQAKLHLADIQSDLCICCKKPYVVQDFITTHKLYVRLPKENIYIEVDKFEHEYLKSKAEELIYIFRKLGARELSIIVRKDNVTDDAQGFNVSGGLANYGVDTGINVQETMVDVSDINTHLTFEIINNINNVKESPDVTYNNLMNDPNIHYLSNHPDGLSFVNDRLFGNATIIEFTFIHKNTLSINDSFSAKLNKIGIDLKNNNTSNKINKLIFRSFF